MHHLSYAGKTGPERMHSRPHLVEIEPEGVGVAGALRLRPQHGDHVTQHAHPQTTHEFIWNTQPLRIHAAQNTSQKLPTGGRNIQTKPRNAEAATHWLSVSHLWVGHGAAEHVGKVHLLAGFGVDQLKEDLHTHTVSTGLWYFEIAILHALPTVCTQPPCLEVATAGGGQAEHISREKRPQKTATTEQAGCWLAGRVVVPCSCWRGWHGTAGASSA